MKNLLLTLVLAAIFTSCNSPERQPCKFTKGDIVIVQPGDIEAIITYRYGCGKRYESYNIQYNDNYGTIQEITIKPFQMKKK